MICGIDEAGRGPLAGPVCAAAVILPPDFPCGILGDSKKLSASSRDRARPVICSQSVAWGIGWATAAEIDEINILQGSLLAMRRAFFAMVQSAKTALPQPLEVIVDGLQTPDIPAQCRAVVRADDQVAQVMAASILAKTSRDRLMCYYSALYPDYGYEKHKGYPTRAHRAAIARLGPSPIQRMTFSIKPPDFRSACR
ncbi:MAG: ribonuclease HII [Treponema sp.]|nr:ribonuclease HII [Treponema sp.]